VHEGSHLEDRVWRAEVALSVAATACESQRQLVSVLGQIGSPRFRRS
jgi:hypothetical protein